MRKPGVYLLSREIQLTIIGVEAFHCPVRDGKEWFHLAMDSGLKRVWLVVLLINQPQSEQS